MATPLPTIATNTEETAIAVLEGNDILEKVNVSILDMRDRVTTVLNDLTNTFNSFTESLKEQQAALINALSLAPNNDAGEGDGEGGNNRKNKTSFLDNVIEKGLMQAAGISIAASIAGIITSMTTWLTGIVTTFTKIGTGLIKFAKLGGRLFLPITLIIGAIGAVSASWESFANGDIWTGLEQAVTGFFNSIVTIPLDLIKDVVAWLLSKMGFDEAADVLNSFSFTEEFNKLIGKLFDGVKGAFSLITDLFTFGEEDKTLLGTLGKLTDIVFLPVNMAINFVSGLFGWSEEGAPPFKLQDWIGEKIMQVIDWVSGMFSWAGEGIAAGWTSLTDYISQKWTDITSWFSEKLSWATEGVGEGWSSLTDYISQKWTDITNWFSEKLSWSNDDSESEEGPGFISKLVSDAWASVTQWFTDSLAGITDSLPSWEDITASIISKLPSWMVPDSYKTPEMLTGELKAKIAENQGLISQIDSGQGGNSYLTRDSVERSRAAEEMAAQQKQLAEIEAQKLSKNGAAGSINVTGGSSTTTQNYGGDSIIMGIAPQIGGGRPDRPF
jgi:hypothetical protein